MERLGAIEDLDTLRDLSGVVRYAAMVCRYVLSKATKLECRKTLPWRPRSACIGMRSLLVAHPEKRSDGYNSIMRSPYSSRTAASAWRANGTHRMKADRSNLEAQPAPDCRLGHYRCITEDATDSRKQIGDGLRRIMRR